MPFEDNTFDVILFYETIEHVENPQECLKEIRRVLKKDGTLILTMDSGSLLFRLVWFVWENTKGKVWQGAHLHSFPFLFRDGGNFCVKQNMIINYIKSKLSTSKAKMFFLLFFCQY